MNLSAPSQEETEALEIVSFDQRRKREILTLAEDTAMEDWLLVNFHNQLMRFGLAVQMGEYTTHFDEQLLESDRIRAFARGWINALGDEWPLSTDFHGIPLNPLIKPALLNTLNALDTVEAVFLLLDCIPKYFEDSQMNLALLRIEGSAMRAMSQEFLTREHYMTALKNYPHILKILDNNQLDQELVEEACRRIPSVIADLDPIWQNQNLVDQYLADGNCSDIDKIRDEFLHKDAVIPALSMNPNIFLSLPERLKTDPDVVSEYLKQYAGGFLNVPPQYVTSEIAGYGISLSPRSVKADFSVFSFSQEEALLHACKYNADFLNFIDGNLLSDKVLKAVVKNHPLAIGYFPNGIKDVEIYYTLAVKKDPLAITYVPLEKRHFIKKMAEGDSHTARFDFGM
jgi:hypothetical protein